MRLFASSPVNRPHACDGKITTGEMADQLVFVAHYGKTTLREKWVGSRFIPDLPNAVPHFTLGYTTFSPIVVADGLKAARARAGKAAADPAEPKPDVVGAQGRPPLREEAPLGRARILPASDADNWLTSGSAAYWAILKKLPDDPVKALESLREALSDADLRLAWLVGAGARRLARRHPRRLRPLRPLRRPAHPRHLRAPPAPAGRRQRHLLPRHAGRGGPRRPASPSPPQQFLALASEVAKRDVRPMLDALDRPGRPARPGRGRVGGRRPATPGRSP